MEQNYATVTPCRPDAYTCTGTASKFLCASYACNFCTIAAAAFRKFKIQPGALIFPPNSEAQKGGKL